MNPHPTFHLRTYGCQMNERDSEALACALEACGYTPAAGEDDADILIFNTCSVRDQAERKVFGKLGLLKRRKRNKPDLVVAVIGCMAQNHARDIIAKVPHVDLVAGTDRLADVPALITRVLNGERGIVATEPGNDAPAPNGHRPDQISAYVAVMRGCNQFCTYCIVPHVRGREKSRPIPEIVTEIETLAAQGTKEVFLLGQNITAYGVAEAGNGRVLPPDHSPFADLLAAVAAVPGVRRIRFTSPHAGFMNAAFIDAVCTIPKVCKAFHIPLQSGSDRVLTRMRRGYTVDRYLDVVRQLRRRLPDVTFSTDVIVGFPGETDADFDATRTVMAEVGFDMAYIFRYSPRTGTHAAGHMSDDVAEATKQQRNQILLADLDAAVDARNRAHVGRRLDVLVEGVSRRNPRRWTGRSDNNKVCIFDPVPGLAPGDLVSVDIRRTTSHALFGDLHAEESA